MSYTVNWIPTAEAELARIWLAAADPRAVTQAADRIDQILARDPLVAGESRDAGRRLLRESPLGVEYRVNASDRTVKVLRVWSY